MTRKPRSRVRILIYRTWAFKIRGITFHCSLFEDRCFINLELKYLIFCWQVHHSGKEKHSSKVGIIHYTIHGHSDKHFLMEDPVRILSYVLVALVALLSVVVIILVKSVQQLGNLITALQNTRRVSCSYKNPTIAIDFDEQGISGAKPPRPTSAFLRGSMESIIMVPSRRASPKERSSNNKSSTSDKEKVPFGTFQ